MNRPFRYAVGGGEVKENETTKFILPSLPSGQHYADAQLQDYQGSRRSYPWRPGAFMSLQARFSHPVDALAGTAGFGFWNAPYGDPSALIPALPQATWFFFASPPNDLPFPRQSPGRGWFAGTVDASQPSALVCAPLLFPVLLLNQLGPLRRRIWPWVQNRLGISFQPIEMRMTAWHEYELRWLSDECEFRIDGEVVHKTRHSPRGPLGFVCWLDNQYLILTPRGKIGAGRVPVPEPQWMEIRDLELRAIE